MRTSKITVILYLLALPVFMSGQPEINSPFSRFGLGDFTDQNFTAVSTMGGLSASYFDRFHSNILNPASLSTLRATAFELGVFARYSTYRGNESEEEIWSGNINNLSLAFPIRNPVNQALDREIRELQWGMSLSLTPYTVVGYNIQNERSQPGTGDFVQLNEGSGGTYRFMWGNGWQYKQVSVGVGLGYLFGSIDTERRVIFGELQNSFANLLNSRINFRGVLWNFGAQYDLVLKTEEEGSRRTRQGINFGMHVQPSLAFNTRSEQLSRRGRNFSFAVFDYVDVDTISYQEDVEQSGELPLELSLGAMYYVTDQWKLGLNYKMANWSKYTNQALPERLEDSWRLSFGGEWIPDIASYNNYFERVHYRAGFYVGTDPRSINGDQVNEWGFSIGTGFPILLQQQQVSYMDLGVELGQRVTDDFKETFIQIRAGFTLNNDRWFLKRRFN